MNKKLNLYQNKLTFLIGIIFGIFFLNFFLIDRKVEINFEELALGSDNKTSMGLENGESIHCYNLNDIKNCLLSYKKTDNKMPVILWLGNSQLHAINQPKVNDEVSSLLLHRKIKQIKRYLLTFSQPNANLQEHFLLFSYLINKFPIKTMILPIVFDDMREDVLRQGVKVALDDSETLETINKTFTGTNLISNINKKNSVGNLIKIEKKNIQNSFEDYLNKKLNDIWTLWNERPYLRSKLFVSIYKFRNSIFGINANTTRKMIKGSYKKNIKAYEDILYLAKINQIKILVYIPPIRNDIKIPYDINEYKNFKEKIKNIANKYNVNFASFENIVKSEFWGYSNSTNLSEELEFDFMHFKGEGHRLLADALFVEIRKMIQ